MCSIPKIVISLGHFFREEQLQEPQSHGDQTRPPRHAGHGGQCFLDPFGSDGDVDLEGMVSIYTYVYIYTYIIIYIYTYT